METFKKIYIIRKRIILAQKQANVVQRNYKTSDSRLVLIYLFSVHLYLLNCVSYNACVHGKTFWFLVAMFLSCFHKLSNNLAVSPVAAFRKFSMYPVTTTIACWAWWSLNTLRTIYVAGAAKVHSQSKKKIFW